MAIINDLLEARAGLSVSGNTLVLPDSSLTNTNWSSAAANRLESAKAVHTQVESVELFEQATPVIAVERLLFIANGAGTFDKLEAAVVTIATGGDRTVNIDLQKSTGGGAFATVLTGTLEFDSADVNLTPTTATFTTTAYSSSDIFKLVITVAGAAGNQALGLIVSTTKSENPN